ncbi:putative metal-dependent hydrolase [Neptunitalea chrysea]|uniref:Metal-dependent hydrolase n=1 Tax=Neptunitalea chrysea TaxID=1647581 RepID=A0A9W6B6F7_9FLAO|nr:putative metal-dependent hydrolase [Neptunitalea chrysea]GLB53716.1 putative metal-dependent hydrolase [Neptunitalea chrysea]
MTPEELHTLKYPLGDFEWPMEVTDNQFEEAVKSIALLPEKLRLLVNGFSSEQLDTPYRPEGWTVKQVVHHLADSHANSYIRYKWALTEDMPTIKAYYEDRWANLYDYGMDINVSLQLLDALHKRWVHLLKSLNAEALKKVFIHPETKRVMDLKRSTLMYAWHGEHHYAHINNLILRMGWR